MSSGYINLPLALGFLGSSVDLTTEVTGILPIANGGTGSATQNFVDLTTAQSVAGVKTFSDSLALTGSNKNVGIYNTVDSANSYFGTYTDLFQVSYNRRPSDGVISNASRTASYINVTGQSGNGYISFSTTNTNNTNPPEVMRLSGNGRMGLGVAVPQSVFHMYETNSTTGAANGITIEQTGTGDAAQHFLLTAGQRYTMGIDNSDSDKFKIGTSADLGTSNLFTMTNAGMIGIGTSAPGTPIHVATTNATVYTPTSASLAIPANVLTTIENLDTTDSTASLLGFVTRSGGAVNRSFIGNVSNSAGGSIIFGHRTGTTSYAERMRIDYLGNLGIGTSSPNANAILDLTSTTKGFLPPRVTTAQKTAIASPAAGLVVYDTTLAKLCVYTTAWETITSV